MLIVFIYKMYIIWCIISEYIQCIIGGAFNFIGSAAASIGPAILTRGATIAPQISGMMIADFNLEKAKAKYGKDNPNALNELVQNDEFDFATPAAISIPAIGLEYVGFKGVNKWIMYYPATKAGTKRL